MKIINYILELAGFHGVNDFLGTFYPLFSTVFAFSISLGSIIGFFELYSGLSIMLWCFFIMGTIADLVFGVIANLVFEKQEFETTKFMRGVFKAFVLFVVIFLTNMFKLGIENSEVKPEILKDLLIYTTATIHYSFVSLIGLYILLSIAENLAKMKIGVAVSLMKVLKVRIKKIENLKDDETDINNNN